MMYWEGINQRKFPRAQYRCKITVVGKVHSLCEDTYTENIGAGGICLILEKPFELFEDVALELFIEDNNKTSINCTGTVVWVVKKHPQKNDQKTRFDTGVEFLNISREDKKRILNLVEKLLSSGT
jgi:Tfp pilus assembly protein PilZ